MKASGYFVVKMPAPHDCIQADQQATLEMYGAHDGDQWRCDCNRTWLRRDGQWLDITPPPVPKALPNRPDTSSHLNTPRPTRPDPFIPEKAIRPHWWTRYRNTSGDPT